MRGRETHFPLLFLLNMSINAFFCCIIFHLRASSNNNLTYSRLLVTKETMELIKLLLCSRYYLQYLKN
jgi:hypothetical protein